MSPFVVSALVTGIMVLAIVLSGGIIAMRIHKATATATAERNQMLRRVALALEKAADDRPAQREATRLAEQNESLVLGITAILDATIDPGEGAREDYAVGHRRGVTEIKNKLRAELAAALKPTN